MAAAPHDHQTRQASPRGVVRLVLAVLVPVAGLTVAAMIWLWPGGTGDERPWTGPQRFTADVIRVVARLTNGPDRGREVVTDIPTGPGAPSVAAGDRVVLIYLPDALSGTPYQIIDHPRGTQLRMLLPRSPWPPSRSAAGAG